MVTKTVTPTEEQAAMRKTLAAAQALAGWEDDRLLGQPRARTIVQVKRAVRVTVGRVAPNLVAQVTFWRLARLIDEAVPPAVSQAQGRALRRRMEAEGDPPLEYEFEPIDRNPSESETADQRKS